MKQLLGICAGLLLTLATVLGAFHLFYDYEYRKSVPCAANGIRRSTIRGW